MKSQRRSWRIISRLGVGGTLIVGASFATTLGVTALATGTASAACGNSNQTVCPMITLSNTSPNAGDTETVTGTGFTPNEAVTVSFDSTALTPTATSDANGNFAGSFTIPSTATVGTHTVTATDPAGDSASATLTVVNSATTTTGTGTSSTGTGTTTSTGSGSSLPVTGADTTKGLLVAADLALLGAPLIVVTRRRRRA